MLTHGSAEMRLAGRTRRGSADDHAWAPVLVMALSKSWAVSARNMPIGRRSDLAAKMLSGAGRR